MIFFFKSWFFSTLLMADTVGASAFTVDVHSLRFATCYICIFWNVYSVCQKMGQAHYAWSLAKYCGPIVVTACRMILRWSAEKYWIRSSTAPQICRLFSFPCPPSPPLPLESGPFKPAKGLGERCKLSQRGPGWSPGRKRIWCTLKLWESHWWQSFWIFWIACFTAERSKFSTS